MTTTMATKMNSSLYYIHDPMCSWCWGYRPVWNVFQHALPDSIVVKYIAGGLAPDSNEPMPVEQQHAIQNHWRTIQQKLGTEFNFDFWKNNTPDRSTYLACRALIAAQQQDFHHLMLEAIQRAYYLRALNPSESNVLVQLVTELASAQNISDINDITNNVDINIAQFETDLNSSETQAKLTEQILLARVLTQQGFPSLVLEHQGQRHSITLDYRDYKISLEQIKRLVNTC